MKFGDEILIVQKWWNKKEEQLMSYKLLKNDYNDFYMSKDMNFIIYCIVSI